jgi:hypothetical protein
MLLTHVERVSPNFAVCVFNDGRVFEVRGDASVVASGVARIVAGENPFGRLNGPTMTQHAYVEEPLITPTMTFDPPPSKRGLYANAQAEALVSNQTRSGEETAWETPTLW